MEQHVLINGTEISDYWGYLKSIDWYDPWLIALVCGHILTTTTAILSRNHSLFQVILFLVMLLLVYFSETINELAAIHWRSFSRQQYFDSSGLFISTVFSIPILLNCMLMIGSWLYNSMQVMTRLKTAQLKERIKRNDKKIE